MIEIEPTIFRWKLNQKMVEYNLYFCQPCINLTPIESREETIFGLPEPDKDKQNFKIKNFAGVKFWCCKTYLCGYIKEVKLTKLKF